MKKKKQAPDIINIKIPEKMKAQLQRLADRYADGNLSAWIRYASINYAPSKDDKIISVKSMSIY